MRINKRKSRRRPICYTAWLVTAPGERQACLLSDMSETGARIDVQEPDTLPDRFVLLLTANGTARRSCRVVWRKPHQIGVKFELRRVAASHATLVPQLAANRNAEAAAHAGAAAPE